MISPVHQHVADLHVARNHALEIRGQQLKENGFTCCVNNKGHACLGAVAIIKTIKGPIEGPIVNCSNQGGGVVCMTLPNAMTCEMQRWSRK